MYFITCKKANEIVWNEDIYRRKRNTFCKYNSLRIKINRTKKTKYCTFGQHFNMLFVTTN